MNYSSVVAATKWANKCGDKIPRVCEVQATSGFWDGELIHI